MWQTEKEGEERQEKIKATNKWNTRKKNLRNALEKITKQKF